MRGIALLFFFSIAALVPTVGSAQVYQFATPPPQVTAATADWQLKGEPIYYAGSFYYPTGPNAFFDPRVMARVGSYKGVPLYADSTLEPYGIVYVPVRGNVMRPYERRREGALAGTIGNRLPSFPIQRDGEASLANGAVGTSGSSASPTPYTTSPEQAPVPEVRPMVLLETERAAKPVATAGTRPNVVESVPPPTSNRGVWITYQGARWYVAGAAVAFDAQRFVAVGEYYGFPVYRERTHDVGAIFVPTVKGGLLTPYHR